MSIIQCSRCTFGSVSPDGLPELVRCEHRDEIDKRAYGFRRCDPPLVDDHAVGKRGDAKVAKAGIEVLCRDASNTGNLVETSAGLRVWNHYHQTVASRQVLAYGPQVKTVVKVGVNEQHNCVANLFG